MSHTLKRCLSAPSLHDLPPLLTFQYKTICCPSHTQDHFAFRAPSWQLVSCMALLQVIVKAVTAISSWKRVCNMHGGCLGAKIDLPWCRNECTLSHLTVYLQNVTWPAVQEWIDLGLDTFIFYIQGDFSRWVQLCPVYQSNVMSTACVRSWWAVHSANHKLNHWEKWL